MYYIIKGQMELAVGSDIKRFGHKKLVDAVSALQDVDSDNHQEHEHTRRILIARTLVHAVFINIDLLLAFAARSNKKSILMRNIWSVYASEALCNLIDISSQALFDMLITSTFLDVSGLVDASADCYDLKDVGQVSVMLASGSLTRLGNNNNNIIVKVWLVYAITCVNRHQL